MRHARYLLTLLFTVMLLPLLAQEPTQPIRLELPFIPEETEVEVIALPDSSLLVYHKTSNAWETKSTFRFTKYNHKLEEVWSDTANISPGSDYIRYYTEAPYTYLAFEDDDYQKYTFVRLHHKTGNVRHKRFELENIDAIYEFNVLQGKYFIIGQNSKDLKPVLFHLNPASAEVQRLPSIYGDESRFSDLLADPEQGRLDAVLTESNGRISRLQVKSFDAQGKLLRNYFILQKEDKSLLNAEITPGDTTQKLLIGTYGSRDLRYSQGFFTMPLSSEAVEGEFYNMLQLKNFLKYMKPRREARTRQREAERLRAGRNPSYHYRLLLHDLIVTPNGYLLGAEAYYSVHKGSNIGHPGIAPILTRYREPEEIKRSHAVVLSFDKNGTLLWDNTFRLSGVTTYDLRHSVELQHFPDGRVIMAYPKNNEIVYHLMNEDKYEDEETKLELKLYREKEKSLGIDQPGIIRWYGNSMAAFGFQRIRQENGPPRRVFYINKISF